MLTDEKERKKLEAYMMRPLAPLPLSAGTSTAPQNGWAPKPYQKGQQGELLNG